MYSAYHPASGPVVEVPDDLTTMTIAAHVPTADGYRTIAGTGDALGTFRIEDVPSGEYVLQLGDRYYATSASDLDGGVKVFGRAHAANAAPDASITLQLDGFEPFSEGSSVGLLAPDIYNFAYLDPLSSGGAPGGTTLAGSFSFAALFFNNAAIDASLGDRLLVLELSPDQFARPALSRALQTDAFTLTSGSATLSGTLSVLPVESFETRLVQSELYPAAGEGPVLVPGLVTYFTSSIDMQVSAMPGELGNGYWGANAYYTGLSVADDPFWDGSIALQYGTLGEGWVPFAEIHARHAIRYRVLPAVTSTTLYLGTKLVDSTAALHGRDVRPKVSGPRAVRIGEMDFLEGGAGGETTPLVSWSAPELGKASWYELWVHELFAEGQVTRRSFGPVFTTTSTSLRVPPGVLEAGRSYVFELKAVSVEGVDWRTQLRRQTFPLAETTVLSGIYVP